MCLSDVRGRRGWFGAMWTVLGAVALLEPGTAQAIAEAPFYRIRVWTAEEGLPQNSVTSIIQTKDGYLWVGTFNGLARFDGVQFTVLQQGNTPGLPSTAIVSLFENRQHDLWMGTVEGDVAQRKGGLVKGYRRSRTGSGTQAIRALTESTDGALWMLTFDWDLMRLDDEQFSNISATWSLEGKHVYGLASDSSGQLWVGTDHELAVWRNGQFETAWNQTNESGFGVSWLAPSRAGGCWMVSNGRVRRFAEGKWQAELGICPQSKAIVDSMCEGPQGQVWVATYGNGLFCFETNRTMQRFSVTNGLPNDFVRCVYEDREGNIWAGTEGGGLARLKPSIFRSYDRKAGLSGDCVLSVCEGDEGEVWIGTNGDGINRFKDGAIRQYGNEQGLTNEFVWSVYQDKSKRVWAGTWGGGLFRLDGAQFIPVARAGSTLQVVCALYEDSKGALWLGQQHSEPEVMQLCADRPVGLRLPTASLRADVRAVTEDRAGNLWIGTYDDGLYRVREGQVSRFGTAEGLKSDRIRALYVDAQGVLWIGTSRGGLNRLKEGRFSAFTAKDGLVDDFIMHIEEDSRGNLWCSTGVGVFRVSKDELDQFGRRQSKTIRCFSYTRADGLPSLECTGGCQPSGCKTRDGRLWFPTVAGLAVVDPEAVPVNPLPPPVMIEEVVLEGKARNSIVPTRESPPPPDGNQDSRPVEFASLKVPAGKQRFEFRYTGLSFTAPEKVRFKYKLEGLEEDWVDAETRRQAPYSYLLPGKYTFRVLACNNDGVWNQAGASVAIIILPHFWQTGWFRALAVVLILLLFVAAYEIRLAAERRWDPLESTCRHASLSIL